eukprot:9006684-Pyramimonas_sp.AAC.1
MKEFFKPPLTWLEVLSLLSFADSSASFCCSACARETEACDKSTGSSADKSNKNNDIRNVVATLSATVGVATVGASVRGIRRNGRGCDDARRCCRRTASSHLRARRCGAYVPPVSDQTWLSRGAPARTFARRTEVRGLSFSSASSISSSSPLAPLRPRDREEEGGPREAREERGSSAPGVPRTSALSLSASFPSNLRGRVGQRVGRTSESETFRSTCAPAGGSGGDPEGSRGGHSPPRQGSRGGHSPPRRGFRGGHLPPREGSRGFQRRSLTPTSGFQRGLQRGLQRRSLTPTRAF